MNRSMIPSDPKSRLPRDQTALALTEAGYPVLATTLAVLAVDGRGPAFTLEKVGGKGRWRACYRCCDAIKWAQKNRRYVNPESAAA